MGVARPDRPMEDDLMATVRDRGNHPWQCNPQKWTGISASQGCSLTRRLAR